MTPLYVVIDSQMLFHAVKDPFLSKLYKRTTNNNMRKKEENF
jgi:hypothetical protein